MNTSPQPPEQDPDPARDVPHRSINALLVVLLLIFACVPLYLGHQLTKATASALLIEDKQQQVGVAELIEYAQSEGHEEIYIDEWSGISFGSSMGSRHDEVEATVEKSGKTLRLIPYTAKEDLFVLERGGVDSLLSKYEIPENGCTDAQIGNDSVEMCGKTRHADLLVKL